MTPLSNRSIFITFEFVGHHLWPEAPTEVIYLRSQHRHLFKVRIDVGVGHNDRQIEYHMMKRRVQDAMRRGFKFIDHTDEFDFGYKSCEAIAERIIEDVATMYPDQGFYRVEVSEDGENGSVVTL